MTPFEVYTSYLALKQHFTNPNYDYIKYNGKVNASRSSFDVRKDNYFFQKLAKRKDVLEFMVANFIEDESSWVGNLTNDEHSEKNYLKWLKRTQSLEYVFRNDLDKLERNFDTNIKIYKRDYPILYKLFTQKQICIETIVIIDDLVGCFDYWDQYIDDKYIYPLVKHKVKKYKSFFKYDKKKFKKILLDKFSDPK